MGLGQAGLFAWPRTGILRKSVLREWHPPQRLASRILAGKHFWLGSSARHNPRSTEFDTFVGDNTSLHNPRSTAFVKLSLDKDEGFDTSMVSSCLNAIRWECTSGEVLEVGLPPIVVGVRGIEQLIDLHDITFLRSWRLFRPRVPCDWLIFDLRGIDRLDGSLELVISKDFGRDCFPSDCHFSQRISDFVEQPQNVLEFEIVEFSSELAHFLSISCHDIASATQIFHDLINHELGVAPYLESSYAELDSNFKTIY